MTVDEFKKLRPDLSHLEGDSLWNAMEDYILRKQDGEEVIKKVMPFFKRYQLRYLFYRKKNNWIVRKGYTSDVRCAVCKVSSPLKWFYDGKMMCGSMKHEYKEEPNTSIQHRIWKIGNYIANKFWLFLEKIHLVRSSNERYGMFGDEARYVHSWTYNMETGETKFNFKKRKWWEYIFIERKFFNF